MNQSLSPSTKARRPSNVYCVLHGLLIAWMVGACHKMHPEKPQFQQVTEVLQPEVSELNLPIILEIAELETLLNEKIAQELYQDLSYDNNDEDNIKMTIARSGDIRIVLGKEKLYTTFPIEVWASKRFLGFGKGKKGKQEGKGVTFQIELQFQSLYHLDERWRLITRTEMKGWQWVQKPVLSVAFFNVDVTKLVEKALSKEKKRITSLIDKAAREQVNLRKAMSKIWKDLQKPMLINRKSKKVWLKAEPFAIHTADLQIVKRGNGQDALLAPITLQAYLSILLDNKGKEGDKTPLPNLQFSKGNEKGFDINLMASVPHYQINETINQNIAGKSFDFEGHHITLKRVEVFGSGKTLVVKVGVKGAINGEVYLKGKPFYDAQTKSVGIHDFDFDVNTAELLLQSADWLLHDTFREEIANMLTFSLSEPIDKLPTLISKGVARGKAGEKVKVDVEAMHINMKAVNITDDQIQLLLNATGKVKLDVYDL